mmetsp:Transcript_106204/g.216523  ORF Transcript_106204/g.216523 Transcript_106204/m.216523 type:complete len:325 (-) Transcript_106204:2010-2984(-)
MEPQDGRPYGHSQGNRDGTFASGRFHFPAHRSGMRHDEPSGTNPAPRNLCTGPVGGLPGPIDIATPSGDPAPQQKQHPQQYRGKRTAAAAPGIQQHRPRTRRARGGTAATTERTPAHHCERIPEVRRKDEGRGCGFCRLRRDRVFHRISDHQDHGQRIAKTDRYRQRSDFWDRCQWVRFRRAEKNTQHRLSLSGMPVGALWFFPCCFYGAHRPHPASLSFVAVVVVLVAQIRQRMERQDRRNHRIRKRGRLWLSAGGHLYFPGHSKFRPGHLRKGLERRKGNVQLRARVPHEIQRDPAPFGEHHPPVRHEQQGGGSGDHRPGRD